jgi:hypothetical protein
MLNHKEVTLNIRKEIKKAGIKARVKMDVSCGSETVRVDVPAYGVEFDSNEQKKIREIGVLNSLSWVRGLEIDVNENTNPHSFVFYA